MSDHVNPVGLDSATNARLRRDGFLKFERLFTPTAVEGFRGLLAAQLGGGIDRSDQEVVRHAGGGQFARYSNNVDITGDVMKSVRDSDEFRALFASIDDGRWLLSQGLGFEIKPGQKGLAWHWGFRSFCFTDCEDEGYTLWIPLDDVDPAKQNGGLPVISTSLYSGRDETKLLAQYAYAHEDAELLAQAPGNFIGHTGLRNAVLDKHAIEHTYTPGDALLFSRFVFHKSAPFHEGPQQRRRAFVMRLIPSTATFNPKLFACSTELFKKFGMHTHEDPVGLRLTDLAPGDQLGTSQYLARLY
jgi:hypothetical protein